MKTLLNMPVFIKSSLFMLSVIFSVGLIFASLELPFKLDEWVGTAFNFPGYDHQISAMHMSKAELYAEHLHLKTLGYFGLLSIVILIITGLFTNKQKLAFIGAFAIFLPVFGHFALTMFFLAGLGFLRFLWIPFTDISPNLMRLGDIILLPRDIFIWAGDAVHINLRTIIPVVFIAVGVVMFVMGVYTWFTTKFVRKNVAISMLYKVSRHPQYLGWILWSYGLFLLPVDAQKRSWSYADTLPWLIPTMIIIAISMMEEVRMKKQFGVEYEKFRSKTAFMFPLPGFLKSALLKPLKVLFGSREYQTKSKVLIFTGIYTILFMLVSYAYLIFTEPSVGSKYFPSAYENRVNTLVHKLENGESRRMKDIAALDLERYGSLAYEALVGLINSPDEHTRNYAVRTLGKVGNCNACQHIVAQLKTDSTSLNFEFIKTLGILKCKEAEKIMLEDMKSPNASWKSHEAIALGRMGSKNVADFLIRDFAKNGLYTKLAYIEVLGRLKATESAPLLIEQLNSENKLILDAAIVALSQIGSKDAIEPLKSLVKDCNWETKIYAEEAINILNDKRKIATANL